MNIWIVADGIAPEKIGGSETQTLGLATELAQNHQVTVLVRRIGNLPDLEKRNSFLIKRLGRQEAWASTASPFTLSVWREIARHRKRIHVLLAKSIYNGWRVCLAGSWFKIQAAVLVEGEQEYRDRGLWNQLILRYVHKKASLIVQSPGIQKELLEKCGMRAAVIPNGVHVTAENVKGDKVLYVGRLINDRWNDKGVRFLIRAVRGLGVETLIVGDGPERKSLEREAGGAANIVFAGRVLPSEIRHYLKLSFVLVVPSIRGEGLPNVILEAMASGVPVIATRTAGIPDIIEPGKTGFLVSPQDSDQIRAYIILLRDNTALQRELSRNCLEEARKYAWDRVAHDFERFFIDLASKKTGRQGKIQA